VATHRVSQYKLTDSKMRDTGGSTSVHARNFSPILDTGQYYLCAAPEDENYHASKATGLVNSMRSVVAGFVACRNAYELPVFMFSCPLSRPFFSASVTSCSRFSGSSSILQKLTRYVSKIPYRLASTKLTVNCCSDLVRRTSTSDGDVLTSTLVMLCSYNPSDLACDITTLHNIARSIAQTEH
jgi:hypothetical protein